MKALLLPVTGSAHVVETDAGLESLQRLVEGYIEPIPVSDKVHLWVDEEAAFPKRLVVNREASHIAGRVLRGPCLLIGIGEDGQDTDVPDEWLVEVVGPE